MVNKEKDVFTITRDLHRAKVNKLELRKELRRTWEELLLEYFENEMRVPSSAQPLMANSFVRTAGHL